MSRRDPVTAVAALASYISEGQSGMGAIPDLLAEILELRVWESGYRDYVHDAWVAPKPFHEFVTDPPLTGLGTSVEWLRSAVSGTAAHDLLDRALVRKPGAPVGNDHAAKDRTTFDNVQGCSAQAPTGNTESAGLRRLRKDRPDLHAQVLEDRLTVHAAMILAGFRPKTFTVREDPESIALAVKKRLSGQQLQRLVELLEDDGNP